MRIPLAPFATARHPASMDPILTLLASLPGAAVSQPFGEGVDVWKVGGKIFATRAADSGALCVKTDSLDTADMLIAAGLARHAPYFHKSWVQLPPDTAPDESRHRIEASYRLIRASLPKKLQTSFAP